MEEQLALENLKSHKSAFEQKCRKINMQLKDPKNKKNQTLRGQLTDEKECYE
jgi:hypothetical protein